LNGAAQNTGTVATKVLRMLVRPSIVDTWQKFIKVPCILVGLKIEILRINKEKLMNKSEIFKALENFKLWDLGFNKRRPLNRKFRLLDGDGNVTALFIEVMQVDHWRKFNAIGQHCQPETSLDIGDAIESALRDGFPTLYLYPES